jgi:Tol biopolymer transport system component
MPSPRPCHGLAALALALAACAPRQATTPAPEPARARAAQAPAPPAPGHELPGERHLKNVRMLTHGGENAEAYWSTDGTSLIFQARRGDESCDTIRVVGADGAGERVIARLGAHTCAFFMPGDERVIFSSTMAAGPGCPPLPDRSGGYVWPLHADHDIYSARPDGSDVRRLTETPGYDAEATVRSDDRIVFTSVRDGDLDIYSMRWDGSEVTRLTTTPGYDGGAFFSPDGTRIVYRAWHPEDPAELEEYRALLQRHLVRPGRLEIWVMDADGDDQRPVTQLGGAAFAPYFTPDGQGVIFASNHEDPKGRNFDLYLIRLDGTGLERVTTSDAFDGFPMFSADGTRLAFCSNRDGARPGDTNVFVADWVP